MNSRNIIEYGDFRGKNKYSFSLSNLSRSLPRFSSFAVRKEMQSASRSNPPTRLTLDASSPAGCCMIKGPHTERDMPERLFSRLAAIFMTHVRTANSRNRVISIPLVRSNPSIFVCVLQNRVTRLLDENTTNF